MHARQVDMEALADNLQKLSEDDLLHVVQMIHDGKNTESYTKNDVEGRARFSSALTPPTQYPNTMYRTPASMIGFGDPFSPLARRTAAMTPRPRIGPNGQMDENDSNAHDYGFPHGIRANLNPIAGEFHVDLYTLPDDLIMSLWNFTQEKA